MNDHLGIGVGAETMSQFLQLGAQFDVIKDLAIEDYPDSAVFVRKRLLAAGKIDDRKPGMSEYRLLIDINAELIGAAMPDRGDHPSDQFTIRLGVTFDLEISGDAAHTTALRAPA